MKTTSYPPLTGQALIEKLNALQEVPTLEALKQCGYVSVNSTGEEEANLLAFYDAILEIQGIPSRVNRPFSRSLSENSSDRQTFELHCSSPFRSGEKTHAQSDRYQI